MSYGNEKALGIEFIRTFLKQPETEENQDNSENTAKNKNSFAE